MQLSEMRTLRNLYHHRELLTLTKTKFISNPTFISSNHSQNKHFSHCFHSSNPRTIHSINQRHFSESSNGNSSEYGSCSNDENPRVWTSYDPVSDRLVTRTVGESENQEVDSSNGDDETRVGLSGFDTVVEDLSPESSVSAVNKPEEEPSGSGNSRSWSSSYYRGKEPLGRKTENQEVGNVNSGVRSGFSSSSQEFVLKKKKGKSKISWVCSSCGDSSSQWWGSCRSCEAVGTLTQISQTEIIEDKRKRSWLQQKSGELQPQRLTDVNKGINQLTWRIPLSGLFGAEVSRVLGGGLVPGCLVLVGGDPGVGKSTLLLQIAAMVAEEGDFGRPAPVVYVSGEESVEQIGNRADRMRIGTEDLFLYSSTDIEDILGKIQLLSPRALIVDSIQTVYLKGVTGSAGGLMQVKECTSVLLRFAKSTNVPVLLIGHVTKTGDIAGPRVLEHIVDVVLYMEGEKYSSHRFLRSVKNRFGSTDELGVFEMSQSGLQAVSNPSEIFLSEQHFDSEVLAGLAVAVIIDGSRTFLIEIQP
ncbi:AAA+ ATPase domain [Macleaya cordata]|uniref:AAA+ ATPase domain n=1 Tax=Macleaya cordata TaxID=56857 RepID=A0A200QPU6_MACCD|nr:AAA+ ATPase domain [Macleaya cordata]